LEVAIGFRDAHFQFRPPCRVVLGSLGSFRFKLTSPLFELFQALFKSGNATVLAASDHPQKSNSDDKRSANAHLF
jgi:hypothetical protein